MSLIELDKIEDGVVSMFKVNLGVKKGERILVLTDVPTAEEWEKQDSERLSAMVRRAVLAKMVSEIAEKKFPECAVKFYAYPSVERNGVEPEKAVKEKMKAADVVVAITAYSLTHTDARLSATEAGARVASMPEFLPEMFYSGGPMTVDYAEMFRETAKLVELVNKAETAVVRSKAGTDITMSLKGRSGIVDAGILTEPGVFGNLPSGEAYIAPVEGTANGWVVIEAGWFPKLEKNLVFTFKNGQVVEVEGGGKVGGHYRELLEIGKAGAVYAARRNLAELGIGTNPNAKRLDNVLEAEKIRGTVHVAIGDNAHMGGKVNADLHQDFVIKKPTLILDGKTIIENGKLKI